MGQNQLLTQVKVHYHKDLYKLVHQLNRALKKDNYIFGLSLDTEDEKFAIFSVYKA